MSVENHEARRRHIAEIVLRVIMQEGVEAATVRRIAAETGYSTTSVTYYFSDKKDLLFAAYTTMAQRNEAKFKEFIAADPPDLVGYLASMSAMDPVDGAWWRACMSFLGNSLHDPARFAAFRALLNRVIKRIAMFVVALDPECENADQVATRLFDLVQGVSIHVLFDPDSWSMDMLRRTLADEIDILVKRTPVVAEP